ncbi:MAG: hypothetical protein JSW28_03140 [Thermoplasmata archaeon]|nr:MAG: hypothetical protein JSW28_03140 [Thermoplasmata archaeon]
MEIKPVEEIIAEIKAVYDNNPLGWRMLRGRDTRGHYDTYIMNQNCLWQLKTEFANPYRPKGVGLRIMDKPSEEIEMLMEIGDALPFSEIYPQRKSHPIFTLGVGRYSPKAADEVKGIISSRQAELEHQLSDSLKKLLHREGMCQEYR